MQPYMVYTRSCLCPKGLVFRAFTHVLVCAQKGLFFELLHTFLSVPKSLVFRAFNGLRTDGCFCRYARLVTQSGRCLCGVPTACYHRLILILMYSSAPYPYHTALHPLHAGAQTAAYSAFGSYRAVRSRCCFSLDQHTRYTFPLTFLCLVRMSCDGSTSSRSFISLFKSNPNVLNVTPLRL